MPDGPGRRFLLLITALACIVHAPAAFAQWSMPPLVGSEAMQPFVTSTDAIDQPPRTLHRVRTISQTVDRLAGPGHSTPSTVHDADGEESTDSPWTWQFLPAGLIYRSYLAGEKAPRFGSSFLHQPNAGWYWEAQVGGRLAIWRYGTTDAVSPQGFEVALEGAAFPRLNMSHSEDVDAVDFRIGLPITWRNGRWAFKAGYAHISSHVGDEFLVRNPDFQRINYVRDSVVVGTVFHATSAVRVYGEVGYAFHYSGGAKPLELQFGTEYSPLYELSSPFAAVNGHLREEMNFSGGLNLMAGWQWRGPDTGRLLRVGVQYFNGKGMQYSFLSQSEQLLGFGAWLDF